MACAISRREPSDIDGVEPVQKTRKLGGFTTASGRNALEPRISLEHDPIRRTVERNQSFVITESADAVDLAHPIQVAHCNFHFLVEQLAKYLRQDQRLRGQPAFLTRDGVRKSCNPSLQASRGRKGRGRRKRDEHGMAET